MDKKERINKIIRKYESLTEVSKNHVEQLNIIWKKKELLRAEYEILTGNDISKRHEAK